MLEYGNALYPLLANPAYQRSHKQAAGSAVRQLMLHDSRQLSAGF